MPWHGAIEQAPSLNGAYVAYNGAEYMLQNDNIPRFLPEDHLKELFAAETPKSGICIENLPKGFAQ